MFRLWGKRARGLACLIFVAAVMPPDSAWSVGLTSEQEALNQFEQYRSPMQLSRDGQWVVHVDPHGGLQRRRANGQLADAATIAVPRFIKAISASRTAAKVAVLTNHGCVGIATFGGTSGAPMLQWLPGSLFSNRAEVKSCETSQTRAVNDGGGGFPDGASIAISTDGLQISLQFGGAIRVIDLATRRVSHELPLQEPGLSGSVRLHLRYVDNNRKLLLVNAVLGERYGTVAAAATDAPKLWDQARSNVCVDADTGDRAATEAAFTRAAHVVKFHTWIQRVTGVPMEPRAAIGEYDAATQRCTPATAARCG